MNPPAATRNPQHPLEKGLSERLRVWKKGRLRAWKVRVAAFWLAAMAVLAVLDYFFPIESGPRLVLVGAIAIGACIWYWVGSLPVRRTSLRQMATHADDLLDDKRHSLLSAYELKQAASTAESPPFLTGKQIADAQLGFFDLPPPSCIPKKMRRAAWLLFWGVVGAVFVLSLWNIRAAPVLVARLLAPLADIPPYSPLHFSITPENPTVVYGGTLDLRTRIDGGNVRGPVVLMTRQGGEIQTAECFRGTDQEFSQRLEQVVQEDLEFAFAHGTARSKWNKIHLLMEPRFSLARFRVTPPSYTGRPALDALLGTEELRGIHGSTATLTITSNRPLSSGLARLKPLSENAPEQQVKGVLTGAHTVEFSWMMTSPATVEIQIQDLQGTPAPEPLSLRQRVIPDERPRLALTEPGSHVLATSSTVLPVAGSASDDFGLRRVDFIRGMPGFRERTNTLEDNFQGKIFQFENELDLSRLGVEPGDVIELYLEGRDYNPSLTGIETSTVSRIEIISDQEYAARLWQEITLLELTSRLGEMQQAIAGARSAMEEAGKQLENAVAKTSQEILQGTEKTVRETGERFLEWSKEFPAFDLEKLVHEQAAEASAVLLTAAERLRALAESQPDGDKAAAGTAEILQAFDGGTRDLSQELAQTQQDLEMVEDLMRQAAAFRQLVAEQQQLARWADRVSVTGTTDPASLHAVARRQGEIRESLSVLPDQIRQAAEKLSGDEQMETLKRQSMEFADALASCGAGESMDNAMTAAGNTNAPETARLSELAANQLEQLLDRNCSQGGACGFAGMASGTGSGDAFSNSLGQLATGLLGRMGAGMFANDGYAVAGSSLMPLPVYGPLRSRVTPPAGLPTVESIGGSGDARPGERLLRDGDQIQAGSSDTTSESAASFDPRRIPEKYRSAVRRFFSISEPTTTEIQP